HRYLHHRLWHRPSWRRLPKCDEHATLAEASPGMASGRSRRLAAGGSAPMASRKRAVASTIQCALGTGYTRLFPSRAAATDAADSKHACICPVSIFVHAVLAFM